MDKVTFNEDESEIFYFGDGKNRRCRRYCAKCGSFVFTKADETDFSRCAWCGSKYDSKMVTHEIDGGTQ